MPDIHIGVKNLLAEFVLPVHPAYGDLQLASFEDESAWTLVGHLTSLVTSTPARALKGQKPETPNLQS